MWEALDKVLAGSFMPHGHCYLWTPSLVWLEVLSNLFIGLAYVSISTTLYVIIRKIKDIPFSWMYGAFGVFIVTCGATHFLDVLTIWYPAYWLDGGVRGITAVASVGTALLLFPLVPKAVGLADAAELAHARGLELEQTYADLATAHEKTTHLERLRTQFFANVSHELRTPLALVLGPAERLLASPDLGAEHRKQVESMARNARALLARVDELLDVARLEAGRMTIEYARVDLARELRLVGARFESLAAERKMTFDVRAPETLLAEVDPAKVDRVVVNLVANAFKFTPDGGEVRCALSVVGSGAGERVRVEVADSGPGVPAADRARVFERFEQLEGGATRRFGGTGLGLAIAKEIVELHGGTIAVDEAPEGGARFVFELPVRAPEGSAIAEAAPSAKGEHERTTSEVAGQAVEQLRPALAAAAPATKAPADDGRPVVLVVEDNREMNAFVTDTLATSFRVERAFDGEEGLARALAHPPDAIVTDVMMPRMSGDELVRRLRGEPSLDRVPVVLLSAKADDALRAELLQRGAQDYVTKPFSPEELVARLTNLVTLKRARDVLEREVSTQAEDLEALATELAARNRELATALDTVEVARDQAERASQLKTSFLAMVSHELRTPITALHLLVDRFSLPGADAPSPKQQQILERMGSATARLADLVDSLLQYARIQSGRVNVDVERVDLAHVAREALDEVRPQAQKKALALESELDGPIMAKTDPKLVRIVVANLVANAVKFTPEGVVKVSAELAGDERVVRVTDSGPGIPDAELGRIFDPFHQVEATRNKHLPGVGLGLSIVREIVDTLGGRIEVSSEVGRGSTFEVRLPETTPTKSTSQHGADRRGR